MIAETFDTDRTAVIEPSMIVQPIPGFPKVAVTCFSKVTFDRLCADLAAVPMEDALTGNANGKQPVFKASWHGRDYALFLSAVGAPSCIGLLEDIAVFGAETFVIFGTCGVLDRTIADCGVMLPTAAVRDEGTSYHYAPPSDEIAVNVGTLPAARAVLDALGVLYTAGKVWTTDGFYRETRGLVERRKAEGCLCVDMECSAVAAWATFRQKRVLQYFYAGDNLDAEVWEPRSLGNDKRLADKDRIAYLAMAMAEKLFETEEQA